MPVKLVYVLFFIICLSCKNKTSLIKILPPPQKDTVSAKIDKSYQAMKDEITRTRGSLKNNFEKLSVNEKSRQFTEAVVKKIVPYWYDTKWDFNGTSRVPQQGSIACGYFVTTILEDAGLKIQRTKLAQSASEQMIKALVDKKYIHQFRNIVPAEFISIIESQGEGIYIIGLDNHTGFLYNDGIEVYFINASYTGCKCVVKEKAIESAVLYYSKYRITGKISDDEKILNKWILGNK